MAMGAAKAAAWHLSAVMTLLPSLAGVAVAQDLSAKTDDKEVQLDQVSIYADRQGGVVGDIPASVTVLEGDALQARGLSTMKDITRYVPGVAVARTTSGANPFGSYTGFNIRGAGGNRVQIMVDGSRTPEANTDGTRDYLDFNFTKQVEVVKGPASVLWGADALGGVVAVETLDPSDILQGEARGGQARIGYDGLASETSVSAAFAQKFGSDWEVMLGLAHSRASEAKLRNARADGGIWSCPRNVALGATHCGQLDPTDLTSTRALAKAVWTPSDAHRVEFSVDVLNRKSEVDVRWGLGPVLSSITGRPTGEILHGHDMVQDISRQRYAVEHTWTANRPWIDELRTIVAYAPGGYERTGIRRSELATGDGQVRDDFTSFKEKFFELDVQARSSFVTASARHDLVWGFDGDLSKTDFKRVQRTTNTTTGTSTTVSGGGFNFANADTRRADIYVQDKITLMSGALEITPGLRYATYSLDPRPDGDYRAPVGQEPQKRSDQKVLKSLSGLYRFGAGWQVWGHYGEGFKMPTAEQMFWSNGTNLVPAPHLQPEFVKSLEVGLRKEFDQGSWGVTVFKADYSNFIKSLEQTTPGSGMYTHKNFHEVEVYGIELNGAYQLNDTLRLSGSATWQRGSQITTATSAKVPHTLPPLQATLGVTYDMPEHGLSFEVVGNFAGAVKRTSSANRYKPAGYGVIDAFARWDVAENAVLNLGVKNLFDKRYFDANAANYTLTSGAAGSQTDPIELQTGPGRVFSVSLDMRF